MCHIARGLIICHNPDELPVVWFTKPYATSLDKLKYATNLDELKYATSLEELKYATSLDELKYATSLDESKCVTNPAGFCKLVTFIYHNIC